MRLLAATTALALAAAIAVPLLLSGDPLTTASVGHALQHKLGASSAACAPVGTSGDRWDCTVAFDQPASNVCRTGTTRHASAQLLAAVAGPSGSGVGVACTPPPPRPPSLEEWRATRLARRACAEANKVAASFGRLDASQRRVLSSANRGLEADAPTPATQNGLQPVLDRGSADIRQVCP